MEGQTIKDLYYVGMEGHNLFFTRIDELGGWPAGFKFVSYYHSGEDRRRCEFGNKYLHTEWWSTIARADEYYMWKLSEDARANLRSDARSQILIELRSYLDRYSPEPTPPQRGE